MSSEKDKLLAAALLENSNQAFRSAINSAVGAAATEAQTAALALSSAKLVNARQANATAEQNIRTARFNAMMDQENSQKLRRKISDLEYELRIANRQNAEMQETMREWVASQRGLMALAKALKEEVETCPSKGHHKLNSQDARKDIAEAAADQSYDSDDAKTAIKNEIPAMSPRHTQRKNKRVPTPKV